MNRQLLLQLAAALSLTAAAMVAIAIAVRAEAPDLEVGEAFARASIGQAAVGVVYLTLHNHSATPDRLLAASSPVASRADLHTHLHDDGVARMRQVDAVAIGPGETVAFTPGGLHIMLTGLAAPLVEGERFALTLQFEVSEPITVEVPVKSSTAGAIPQGAGAHTTH
jgi:periplasmic copper chaperone A